MISSSVIVISSWFTNRTYAYGRGDTLEKRSSDGISINPTNSACNLITDDYKQAIECSAMTH